VISRAVLNAQREQYVKGREQAVASVSAFNGAIEAIDNLLGLCDEYDAAQANRQDNAATVAAEEHTNA